MAFATARIFIPGRFFAGEAVGENIGPAIAIEVVGERKKIVGVRVVRAIGAFEAWKDFFGAVGFFAFESGVGRINFVAVRETRALVPIRARDNVVNSVAVEIAKCRAFGPELVVELILQERVKDIFGSGQRRSEEKQCEQNSKTKIRISKNRNQLGCAHSICLAGLEGRVKWLKGSRCMGFGLKI